MELLLKPWPWYVAGPLISLIMFLLLYFGKSFGFSSNLRTMCTIGGAGKIAEFFRFDWKGQKWNLFFLTGAIIGGFLTSQFLMEKEVVDISSATIAELKTYGIKNPGETFFPTDLFQWSSIKSIAILFIGGLFVGFGSRYAGGCTSGHAISGISNLQVPSIIAVIGFFIGGLIMSWLFLPYIF